MAERLNGLEERKIHFFNSFTSSVTLDFTMRRMYGSDEMPYYTTKAVRGPMTKINQSNRSIAGPIFSSIGPAIVPNDPVLCPAFNLKPRCRTMQVFVRRCFCRYWPSIRQKKAVKSVRKTSIGRLLNADFSRKLRDTAVKRPQKY